MPATALRPQAPQQEPLPLVLDLCRQLHDFFLQINQHHALHELIAHNNQSQLDPESNQVQTILVYDLGKLAHLLKPLTSQTEAERKYSLMLPLAAYEPDVLAVYTSLPDEVKAEFFQGMLRAADLSGVEGYVFALPYILLHYDQRMFQEYIDLMHLLAQSCLPVITPEGDSAQVLDKIWQALLEPALRRRLVSIDNPQD